MGQRGGLCLAVWGIRGVYLIMKETISRCVFVSGRKLGLPDSLWGLAEDWRRMLTAQGGGSVK